MLPGCQRSLFFAEKSRRDLGWVDTTFTEGFRRLLSKEANGPERTPTTIDNNDA